MTTVLVGFNHQTAPVELREKFFLSEYGQRLAMESLVEGDHPGALQECVIVSTCNRLEFYGESTNPEASREAIVELLACLHDMPLDDLNAYLYVNEGRDAIDHLMRVAAGLDSLIPGEPQILGQVADAFSRAQEAKTSGTVLSHLFSQAVHAGKRARTETDISRYTMNTSHAAVHLVKQQVGGLSGLSALVIGAGEMAELAARALRMHGVASISVISRTFSHAQMLAKRYDMQPLEWNSLRDALASADIVISATSAPHLVVRRADVEAALAERDDRPLLMVDVAVPRDIEESVSDFDTVTLYDIDDLRLVIDRHRAQRLSAVTKVEDIVVEEINAFMQWTSSRQIVPLIVDLRRKAEALAEAEVEQALRRLDGLDEREQAIVSQMAHRIVNKLLHTPTTTLKLHAAEGHGDDYAQTVRELFALEAHEAASLGRAANE